MDSNTFSCSGLQLGGQSHQTSASASAHMVHQVSRLVKPDISRKQEELKEASVETSPDDASLIPSDAL